MEDDAEHITPERDVKLLLEKNRPLIDEVLSTLAKVGAWASDLRTEQCVLVLMQRDEPCCHVAKERKSSVLFFILFLFLILILIALCRSWVLSTTTFSFCDTCSRTRRLKNPWP